MKNFKEFVNAGIIKKIFPNKSKARDLFQESERKKTQLAKILKLIGLFDENANDAVEYCYDIIMYTLRAKLYLMGLKSAGEGAHEAEISYMRKLGFSEKETLIMNDLRYHRNGIQYYGKSFDKNYARKVLEFLDRMYPILKNIAGKMWYHGIFWG